ncbi:endonuclease/exonuclease/phosphatase family protein [Actinoplanes derwentensis]|uniref:Exodeoxyribonuclease-3 n=1 Tax=Actinoplanes derwentensis TaxID=113562 RepID=A0A1H2D8M5_9ACTN|nr:endonuclease/exonuclease/phosphatase family protein [Actinoplanes derwentensis]GID86237.1 endonuclease [Actinoplanes derwentensis]SDT78812.1 exodeoxyribonuclease-3 [Actinoplanes derwentensis]
MTLRLMTWNIKHGGGDRLQAIIQVIRDARPDVLCLQELLNYRRYGRRRLQELATATGMTAHMAPSALAQPVAVLVRNPFKILRRTSVTWRLHHAAAEVVVETGAGPLTVVSTHLNPFSPSRRYREARWLAARHASADGLVVIAGDMNGLDPLGDHERELAGLPSLYRQRHLAPDGTADTRAIAAFHEEGYTDLWHTVGEGDGRTVPTDYAGREFGAVRLDYLMASPALAARAERLWSLRDETTATASDHYPVRADVDL